MLDDQGAPEAEAQAALMLAPTPAKRKRGRPRADERHAQIAAVFWQWWYRLPPERHHASRAHACELVSTGSIARALNSESRAGGTTLPLGSFLIDGEGRWDPYHWCAEKVRKQLSITLATSTIKRIADKHRPPRIEPLRWQQALSQINAPMGDSAWTIWSCISRVIHPSPSGLPARLTEPDSESKRDAALAVALDAK